MQSIKDRLREQDRLRAVEAARLRSAGGTWKQIADALGYANESGPLLLVKRHGLYDPACVFCGAPPHGKRGAV
jgi:hypothetical protein